MTAMLAVNPKYQATPAQPGSGPKPNCLAIARKRQEHRYGAAFVAATHGDGSLQRFCSCVV
jgi:hypothetical protein